MKLDELVRLASRALAATRGRSALTVLTITIGAFAIVLMSSRADSGLAPLRRGIEDLGGARIVFVAPKDPVRGDAKRFAYRRGISLADRDAVISGAFDQGAIDEA